MAGKAEKPVRAQPRGFLKESKMNPPVISMRKRTKSRIMTDGELRERFSWALLTRGCLGSKLLFIR